MVKAAPTIHVTLASHPTWRYHAASLSYVTDAFHPAESLLERIEIEPDDIANLVDEKRIARAQRWVRCSMDYAEGFWGAPHLDNAYWVADRVSAACEARLSVRVEPSIT